METVLYQYLIEYLFDVSMNACKIQAKDTTQHLWFLFICELDYGIVNIEDVLLRRISGASMNSFWSFRLYHNLWNLISECLKKTNSLRIISNSLPESLYFCERKGRQSKISHLSKSPSNYPNKRSNSYPCLYGPQGQGLTPSPMDDPLLNTELSPVPPLIIH